MFWVKRIASAYSARHILSFDLVLCHSERSANLSLNVNINMSLSPTYAPIAVAKLKADHGRAPVAWLVMFFNFIHGSGYVG